MAELLLGCRRVLLYWPDRKNARLQLANAPIAVRRSVPCRNDSRRRWPNQILVHTDMS